jgi:hypothetical protein
VKNQWPQTFWHGSCGHYELSSVSGRLKRLSDLAREEDLRCPRLTLLAHDGEAWPATGIVSCIPATVEGNALCQILNFGHMNKESQLG